MLWYIYGKFVGKYTLHSYGFTGVSRIAHDVPKNGQPVCQVTFKKGSKFLLGGFCTRDLMVGLMYLWHIMAKKKT